MEKSLVTMVVQKLNFPDPKTLFFWDGLGALVSFSLLYFVLEKFTNFFGMPEEAVRILYCLAGICFLLSSFSYIFIRNHWRIFIALIILANAIYLIISSYILVEHISILNIAGFLYFGMEKIIIICLVYMEWRFLREKNSQKI